MTDPTKLRTITMTDTPPVRIREATWPVIAHGRHYSYQGQYDFQAVWILEIDIRVRRHADGRTLVYAIYEYTDKRQGATNTLRRGGQLFQGPDGNDLVRAIRDVGAGIGDDPYVEEAIADCIATLPAIDI